MRMCRSTARSRDAGMLTQPDASDCSALAQLGQLPAWLHVCSLGRLFSSLHTHAATCTTTLYHVPKLVSQHETENGRKVTEGSDHCMTYPLLTPRAAPIGVGGIYAFRRGRLVAGDEEVSTGVPLALLRRLLLSW